MGDTPFPDGLTREHVLESLRRIARGDDHAFAESTGFDVLFESRRYPPKAVVGVALEVMTGQPFGPYDFKGGLGSKCFRELNRLGFVIIRKGDSEIYPDELPEQTYVEGAVLRVFVNRYERDPAARAACIAAHGLRCRVCEVDLKERYGEIAAGFIHVHHLRPIAQACGIVSVDPIRDLAPVCPNCHAMLHRREPLLTIEELRSIMAAPAG